MMVRTHHVVQLCESGERMEEMGFNHSDSIVVQSSEDERIEGYYLSSK